MHIQVGDAEFAPTPKQVENIVDSFLEVMTGEKAEALQSCIDKEIDAKCAGPSAFQQLTDCVQADEGYAWAIHCNLSVPMQDEGVDHVTANKAAARIMYNFFSVDTSKFKEYKAFKHDQ